MPLVVENERAPMPAETFLFIVTGLHGQAAIDKLLADMANEIDGKEVTPNGSAKKAG